MSASNRSRWIGAGVALLACVSSTHGQHTWQRTLTVSPAPNGGADFTTIQAAINDAVRIGTDPTERYTVLICAGTYNENVALTHQKENVDLVGIDRDAVIIAPSSGDGITITSGDEDARNNSIRNLTIKTTNGHGIKMVKGGGVNDKVPKNITIEGVTIEANGTGMDGIYASEVETLRIANCKITTANGHGIEFIEPDGGSTPKDVVVEGVTIEAAGTGKYGIDGLKAESVRVFGCDAESTRGGIRSGDKWTIQSTSATATGSTGVGFVVGGDATVIKGCRGKAKRAGLKIDGADGVRVESSFFHGGIAVDMAFTPGKNVLLRDCYLLGDYAMNGGAGIHGLVIDANGNENIALKGCRIEAIADGEWVHGVWNDAADLRLEDCEIIAQNLYDGQGQGVGKATGLLGSAETWVVGGSIETTSADERENQVWDLNTNTELHRLYMSRTRMTKWKGPIFSAGRPRSVVQRTLNVAMPSDTAILPETNLDPNNEKVITTDITDPDVYRVLKAHRNHTIGDQTVIIIGTNFAGETIADQITIADTTNEQDGVKPFKTVTKIILPQGSALQAISIGTTAKLGLQFPISATTDVQQQGRKSANDYYQLESVGNVEAVYATVDVSATLAASNSFEWAVLASE